MFAMYLKTRLAVFCALLAVATQCLLAQLTITVTAIPANTPDGATLYIAGNFNGWNPGNPANTLTPNGNGTWSVTISPALGLVEYKFTRGSWDTVEGNETGGFQPNHQYSYTGGVAATSAAILSWEDLGGGTPHTAADNVQIISEDFYLPELDRYRRIWIYLPPDYETSGKNYPVLYLQDGQNLFDAYYSFAGEWEIDESLNQLFNAGDYGAIAVGIDNGGSLRIDEYSPWVNTSYGGGDGDEYAEFIVNTLKPYIDTHYRTLPQREYTGIMGSSMGGLISLYAALQYQDVFGKAGIFSPSFWFADDCYTQAETIGKQYNMRIYLLAGGLEGYSMVPDMLMMYNTLLDSGFTPDELFYLVEPDGTHSEWFWNREFPDAYQWLFANSPTGTSQPALPLNAAQIYPNPAKELLHIQLQPPVQQARVQIFSAQGQKALLWEVNQSDTIFLGNLPNGIYLLQVVLDQHILYSRKLTIIH
ncbi:T9SS C-terminal target domain-containing protein [Sphingobacteriales bacterium UPWRP_1]|nr:hypothetical protein B6N25_12735 [Sphingobacteriales bacterium TSM_CSS]PSJ76957.1 T9SS C-terminal target domain-containing protein [Sphingobacteriales bacterium UPWRP_1]